ncbi:MAG: hypothetical protein C3F11_02640 [Methylocystaceae bacterium]|nr:MAG: hypothetical protein C3F11_02640 [Methylocystaceae bacterium]
MTHSRFLVPIEAPAQFGLDAASNEKYNFGEKRHMHSNAEIVKAVAGILGALGFFIVVIHQITKLIG